MLLNQTRTRHGAATMRAVLGGLLLALCVASAAVSAAGKRGHFGFTTQVQASGAAASATLQSVTVGKVEPGSPAASAGLQVGDVLLSVNDKPVPGSQAGQFMTQMASFAPGDHLRLKVERAGKPVALDLVAAEK